MSEDLAANEVSAEQDYVGRLYVQLDEQLAHARAALDRTARSATVGTPGALPHRARRVHADVRAARAHA